MPKVKMDKVRTEEVYVDIPDKCPGCGADFTNEEENNLEEQRWVGYAQNCHLRPMSESSEEFCVSEVEMGETDKNIYEIDLVFCYMCRRCDCVLADTTEESSDVIAKAPGRDSSG